MTWKQTTTTISNEATRTKGDKDYLTTGAAEHSGTQRNTIKGRPDNETQVNHMMRDKRKAGQNFIKPDMTEIILKTNRKPQIGVRLLLYNNSNLVQVFFCSTCLPGCRLLSLPVPISAQASRHPSYEQFSLAAKTVHLCTCPGGEYKAAKELLS